MNRPGRRGFRRSGAILAVLGILLRVATAGLAGSWWPALALAEDGVPPSRRVVIIMRALAYDENLKKRAGSTIHLAVLYRKGNAVSEQTAVTMAKAFGALTSAQVAGLSIVVSRLAYGGAEALNRAIGAAEIDMIYACDGLEAEVGAITGITRQRKVLTVGSSPEQVRKGFSMGVFQLDSTTIILLNLPASRQEGAAFATDLLRLATVIR